MVATLLLLILIIILIISFVYSSFVLKKFILEPNNVNGNIVTIVARKSGIIAWLLTHLFKISPETSLLATTKDVRFKYQKISREDNALITMKSGISNIYCQFKRPIWALVISVIFLLLNINTIALMINDGIAEQGEVIAASFGLLIPSIILFLVFYFGKSISIIIESHGTKHRIKFKPALIEGEDVNIERARDVVKVIQDQIIKEQNNQTHTVSIEDTNITMQCPYCGEKILTTAKKCKHCGEWLEKG